MSFQSFIESLITILQSPRRDAFTHDRRRMENIPYPSGLLDIVYITIRYLPSCVKHVGIRGVPKVINGAVDNNGKLYTHTSQDLLGPTFLSVANRGTRDKSIGDIAIDSKNRVVFFQWVHGYLNKNRLRRWNSITHGNTLLLQDLGSFFGILFDSLDNIYGWNENKLFRFKILPCETYTKPQPIYQTERQIMHACYQHKVRKIMLLESDNVLVSIDIGSGVNGQFTSHILRKFDCDLFCLVSDPLSPSVLTCSDDGTVIYRIYIAPDPSLITILDLKNYGLVTWHLSCFDNHHDALIILGRSERKSKYLSDWNKANNVEKPAAVSKLANDLPHVSLYCYF